MSIMFSGGDCRKKEAEWKKRESALHLEVKNLTEVSFMISMKEAWHLIVVNL